MVVAVTLASIHAVIEFAKAIPYGIDDVAKQRRLGER